MTSSAWGGGGEGEGEGGGEETMGTRLEKDDLERNSWSNEVGK